MTKVNLLNHYLPNSYSEALASSGEIAHMILGGRYYILTQGRAEHDLTYHWCFGKTYEISDHYSGQHLKGIMNALPGADISECGRETTKDTQKLAIKLGIFGPRCS